MQSLSGNQRESITPAPPPDDLLQLRRAIRDLVALSALPSIWVDTDLKRSLQNLTDVLRTALRAFTVCLRIELPDGSRYDTRAADGLSNAIPGASDATALLDAVPASATTLLRLQPPNFNGEGPWNALPYPLVAHGRRVGLFVACYKADIVPPATDHLILQVAANQIPLLFHRYKEQDATRKLAAIVESSRDPIISKSLDGIVTSWNPAAEALFGYPAAEMIGQPILRIIPGERVGEEDMILSRLQAGQSVEQYETVRLTKTGQPVPVVITVSPIKNTPGEVVGASKIVHDITERKNAEQALLEMNLALAYATPGISLLTPDGRYSRVNEPYARMMGYEAAEMVGLSWQPTVHPEDRMQAMAAYQRMLSDGNSEFEARAVRKDGSHFYKQVWMIKRVDNHGNFLGHHCFMRDVTERKQAEQRLRESQARAQQHAEELQALIEALPNPVWISKDANCKTITGNRACYELLGLPLGANLSAYGNIPYQHRIGGRPVPPEELPMQRAVATGEPQRDVEVEIIRADRQLRCVLGTAMPLMDPTGAIRGCVGAFVDITERKRAEETIRFLHSELQQHTANLEKTVAERTASLREMVSELQQLSYSITHDMRAPLRAMAGFAQLLLEQSSSGSDDSTNAQDYCRRILIAASRLDKLIHDALNYSKTVLQQCAIEPVHLSKLLRGIIDTYPNLHPDTVDIAVDGNMPVVLGNESLLTQCFSNLLGNAVKFIAPGTRSQVRVSAQTTGATARIWVEDNGIGIPEYALPRLFGMFQKLDSQYEGTGIGLAIVRKVIERMGGRVGVESKVGCGSRFWVELPIAPANA